MVRTLIISAASGAALMFSATAFAGGQGPEEAKAMLQKPSPLLRQIKHWH